MFRTTIIVLLVSIMSATALPQQYRQPVNNTCFDFENRFKSSDDFEDYEEYEEYKDERDAVYKCVENTCEDCAYSIKYDNYDLCKNTGKDDDY